jgi:hypothetical protein
MIRPAAPLMACLLSCTAAPRAWPSPDAVTYGKLRARLHALREARPQSPWAAGIHVVVREPSTGRTIEGRGGLAVAPGRAVRMILVGGAGSTLLDAWVSPDRYRVAIPALDRVRTGRDEAVDLPVGFLRWWFLAPLTGTVFAASDPAGDDVWLVRSGASVVELRAVGCARGEGLLAVRRTPFRAEQVRECRAPSSGASVGDSAEYDDLMSGLHVEIAVESVASTPPDDAAFQDPDLPGGAP